MIRSVVGPTMVRVGLVSIRTIVLMMPQNISQSPQSRSSGASSGVTKTSQKAQCTKSVTLRTGGPLTQPRQAKRPQSPSVAQAT